MELAQPAVDLQELTVATVRIPDAFICPPQAAEPGRERRPTRTVLRLVYYDPRQAPVNVEEAFQERKHLIVGPLSTTGRDEVLCGGEGVGTHDWFESGIRTNPILGSVDHPPFFQLEGDAVVDVVPRVFLVRQHLPHGARPPAPPQVGRHAFLVEDVGYLGFEQAAGQEHRIHPADDPDLGIRPRDEDDPVRLEAFTLAPGEVRLGAAVLVQHHPAQSIAGGAALAVTHDDQAALAFVHLDREILAVGGSHDPFDALEDGGWHAAVVLKLLGTVVHRDAGLPAFILVGARLVGVLESAPSAHVVDEYGGEVGGPCPNVGQQAPKLVPTLQAQAAFARVLVGPDYIVSTADGVGGDHVSLVLGRIPLVIRRHPDVLRGSGKDSRCGDR